MLEWVHSDQAPTNRAVEEHLGVFDNLAFGVFFHRLALRLRFGFLDAPFVKPFTKLVSVLMADGFDIAITFEESQQMVFSPLANSSRLIPRPLGLSMSSCDQDVRSTTARC